MVGKPEIKLTYMGFAGRTHAQMKFVLPNELVSTLK